MKWGENMEKKKEMKEKVESNLKNGKTDENRDKDSRPTEREENLREELEKCEKRVKELEEYAKRNKAALENLRREKDEEVKEAVDYANKNLVERLVYVMDDMERLLKHFENKSSLEYEALKMVYAKFKDILVSEGLKEIESKGKFDPFDHDAVERVESETHEDWDIVEVVEKGYKFRSKLIRPSKVKVAVHVKKTDVSEGEKKSKKGEDGD